MLSNLANALLFNPAQRAYDVIRLKDEPAPESEIICCEDSDSDVFEDAREYHETHNFTLVRPDGTEIHISTSSSGEPQPEEVEPEVCSGLPVVDDTSRDAEIARKLQIEEIDAVMAEAFQEIDRTFDVIARDMDQMFARNFSNNVPHMFNWQADPFSDFGRFPAVFQDVADTSSDDARNTVFHFQLMYS